MKRDMEDNNEKQELDLFTLLQKIWGFLYDIFKKVIGFCGYLLQIVFKYKYLFLLVFAGVVAYSFYSTQGPRKIYGGQFTSRLNDGDSDIYKGILQSLNQYLTDKDVKGLAEVLQIPVEQACKISHFGFNFTSEPADTTRTYTLPIRKRASIAILTTDMEAFPALKEILINHFKKNEYLMSLNNVRINSLQEKVRILEKEIATIDSLQKIVYFQNAYNQDIKLEQGLRIRTDKQMFYQDKLMLAKEKEEITNELAQNHDLITVIAESSPTKKSVNRFTGELKKYGIGAFLLSFIIFLFWEHRKAILSYLKRLS